MIEKLLKNIKKAMFNFGLVLTNLFIVLITLNFYILPALAVDNGGEQNRDNLDITLSPIFFEYKIKNQKQIRDQFSLRNNSGTPMELTIALQRLSVDSNGDLTLSNTGSSENKWIKISKNRIALKAGESATIPFEIVVPPDAAYGNYWAISVSNNNDVQKSGNISLSGSANIPVLIHIDKPGVISNAEIIEFGTESLINEYLPVDFLVKIKNTGNTHIRPRGNIFINDHSGKNIAILDINKDSGSILPKARQEYNSSWADGFFVKDYQSGDLVIHWDKPALFRMGKYTAHLFLVFDGGNKDITLESKIDFWVIPYTIVFSMILAVFGIIFVFRFLLKIYIKSQVKKYTNKSN